MRNQRFGRRRRRGLAVIIVLAILSITLALSYSVLRTQVTAVQIQTNANRRGEARQAAQAGVSAAMRRMHDSDWDGADSALSGDVSGTASYQVAFVTGDDSLAEGDADYAEWPYRVTITSTGQAVDPANPQLRSEHTIRVVMQLVRRQRGATPAGWTIPQSYVVYQWKPNADYANNNRFLVEYPARINGRVRLQGRLDLCVDYPEYDQARQRLLSDLNLKRLAGLGDNRPLTGRVDLPYAYTSAATLTLVTTSLAAATLNVAQSSAADLPLTGVATTYRLYEGGLEYEIPDVGGALANVTLEPDPTTNPLGFFRHTGRVDVGNNVTIRGTLIVTGDTSSDVYIAGTNVQLEGADLAALDGATQPVQLPALIVGDDVYVSGGASAVVRGMLIVDDELEVEQANQASTSLTLEGRLICGELLLHGRHEWDQSSAWYQSRYGEFLVQMLLPGGELYFPDYLELWGLAEQPRIVLQGPASAVSYHLQSTDDPLYEPHSNDDALVWDLVEWTDQ
jgi:hypothetical protein